MSAASALPASLPMALSPARTRLLVIVFVTVALALAVLATVVITHGWDNDGLQEHLQEQRDAGLID